MGKSRHGMALESAVFIGDTATSVAAIAAPGAGKRLCIVRAGYNVDAKVSAGTFFWTDGTSSFDPMGKPQAGVPYGFSCHGHYTPLAENTALTLDKDAETTSTNGFVLFFKEDINASTL